jgi:protoporphyrinogen oxidase
VKKTAVIIGAGPAGLTAALEFLRKTDVQPIVLEASQEIGGISRTIRYKGNRMDIGGHRFFSKSDRVMQWWMDLMPPDATPLDDRSGPNTVDISYQGKQRSVIVPGALVEEPPLRGMGPLQIETDTEETDALGEEIPAEHGHTTTVAAGVPASEDLVMLVRPRKSRIYYLRKFFDYPIKLSGTTITNLGPVRMARIAVSYAMSRVRPIKEEKSLEDFLINRFGRELYLTFFKSYTEKVWGTPCNTISAEWGAQRIKGLSLTTAVKHFVRKTFVRKPSRPDSAAKDVAQKGTDTSLIERFLYPKFGPGQLWEHVAEKVLAMGGEIHMGCKVDSIETELDPQGVRKVLAVNAVNEAGEHRRFMGDYFLSTMPMRDLVRALDGSGVDVPADVREISEGLQYRDFVTVGVLANKLDVHEPEGGLIRDTWIYIQEPDVLLGRLQIFNNWSPYMVADPAKVWIGLEYFCYDTDPLWAMPDEELKRFAAAELEKIGILKTAEVLDAHVVRVPKTYPAYFGTYDRFDELRAWTDSVDNLFLVGRNGMHKYNNQDHSMLTAMAVVDGIAEGHVEKSALWGINTEQEYHEEKKR